MLAPVLEFSVYKKLGRNLRSMANIKSAKKRILVNEKKKAQNTSAKSELKTCIKKYKATVAEGDKATATTQLNECFSQLDKAVAANLIHKNKAANNKAALSKMLDKMA